MNGPLPPSANPQAAIQNLVGLLGGAAAGTFAPTSRYAGIDTTTLETPDGRTVVYLLRRFVPSPERFTVVQEHVVTGGERLDNIAYAYLGDPELFWRLCDANGALRPDELTEKAGRSLRITLPEGIPGVPGGPYA